MHTISNRLAAIATFLAARRRASRPGRRRSVRRRSELGPAGAGHRSRDAVPGRSRPGIGLWTASRGSTAGRLAVVAGLLYLVYNYAIFAFSVAMNPLTAVHIAIFGLSLWSLLLAGRSAVDGAEAVTERLNRRAAGGLLVGVGAMFGLLWLGQIATVATTGVLPPDLVKADISSNPVYALDLAFFLPLCALAGIGLLRRNGARGLRLLDAGVGSPDGRGRGRRHHPDGCGRRQDRGAGGGRHHRPCCRFFDPRRGCNRAIPGSQRAGPSGHAPGTPGRLNVKNPL